MQRQHYQCSTINVKHYQCMQRQHHQQPIHSHSSSVRKTATLAVWSSNSVHLRTFLMNTLESKMSCLECVMRNTPKTKKQPRKRYSMKISEVCLKTTWSSSNLNLLKSCNDLYPTKVVCESFTVGRQCSTLVFIDSWNNELPSISVILGKFSSCPFKIMVSDVTLKAKVILLLVYILLRISLIRSSSKQTSSLSMSLHVFPCTTISCPKLQSARMSYAASLMKTSRLQTQSSSFRINSKYQFLPNSTESYFKEQVAAMAIMNSDGYFKPITTTSRPRRLPLTRLPPWVIQLLRRLTCREILALQRQSIPEAFGAQVEESTKEISIGILVTKSGKYAQAKGIRIAQAARLPIRRNQRTKTCLGIIIESCVSPSSDAPNNSKILERLVQLSYHDHLPLNLFQPAPLRCEKSAVRYSWLMRSKGSLKVVYSESLKVLLLHSLMSCHPASCRRYFSSPRSSWSSEAVQERIGTALSSWKIHEQGELSTSTTSFKLQPNTRRSLPQSFLGNLVQLSLQTRCLINDLSGSSSSSTESAQDRRLAVKATISQSSLMCLRKLMAYGRTEMKQVFMESSSPSSSESSMSFGVIRWSLQLMRVQSRSTTSTFLPLLILCLLSTSGSSEVSRCQYFLKYSMDILRCSSLRWSLSILRSSPMQYTFEACMLNLALLFMNDILLLSRLNVLSSATAFSVVVSCRLSILSASLAIYCSGVTASMCNSWMATLSLSCRCRKLVLSVERNSFSFAARSGILPLSAQRILLRKNVRSLALLTVTLKEPLLQQSISTLSRDAQLSTMNAFVLRC